MLLNKYKQVLAPPAPILQVFRNGIFLLKIFLKEYAHFTHKEGLFWFWFVRIRIRKEWNHILLLCQFFVDMRNQGLKQA